MNFEPNAVYHIYNRTNETLFYSNENYIFFLKKMKKLIYPACNILAWVLMPNHFHFLVEATEKSCSVVSEKHRPMQMDIGLMVDIMKRVPKLCDQSNSTIDTVIMLLKRLYPGERYLNPLEPDILAEHLADVYLEKYDELYEAVLEIDRENGSDLDL